MSEEVTNTIIQLKGLLNKYPDKTLEILQYVFGKDTLEEIADKSISEKKHNNIHIYTRYGEELYKEYLEKENKRLKKVIDEVREKVEQVAAYPYANFDIETKEGEYQVSITEWLDDLLQILDKVDKNHVY